MESAITYDLGEAPSRQRCPFCGMSILPWLKVYPLSVLISAMRFSALNPREGMPVKKKQRCRALPSTVGSQIFECWKDPQQIQFTYYRGKAASSHF